MHLKELIGSGDKIGLLVLPFIVAGVAGSIIFPGFFSVGGPGPVLRTISIVILIPGVIIWIWAAILILTKAARQELITSGPYALIKHPIYDGVALLVLPWLGFLLDSWLGSVIGAALLVGSWLFSREEERGLAQRFGGSQSPGFVNGVLDRVARQLGRL